jgi:hypothetical protein
MKAKGFKDWLSEAQLEDWGRLGATTKWYDNKTDFSKLFGTGIWNIKYWDEDLSRLGEILDKLAELTRAEMRPIFAVTDGDGDGRVKAYFGSDIAREDLGKFDAAIDELRVGWKRLGISIVAANYSGIRQIDLESLETGQLYTILDWSKKVLSAEGVKALQSIMDELPNWRDDRTDWVLDDWLGEASDHVRSILAEARRWGGTKVRFEVGEGDILELDQRWDLLDWSLKWRKVPHEEGYYYRFHEWAVELADGQVTITPSIKWEVSHAKWTQLPLVELRDQFRFTDLSYNSQLAIAIGLRLKAQLEVAYRSQFADVLHKLWKQHTSETYEALLTNRHLSTETVMEMYFEIDDPELKELAKAHPNFGDATEWALDEW